MADTLFVIDDDDFFRTVTQSVLEEAGYGVLMAEDGMSGWETLDQTPTCCDLILLDKNMPQLDGIALLKRIKSDPRFKDLPVIMLTGDDRQQDITEGLEEGAYYYLTKPSTEEVLLRVIRNALNDWQQKRELRAQIGLQKNNLGLMRRAEFSFKTLSEARDLALLLADASTAPERTLHGYSELLINAVEHGNLGITYAEKTALMNEGRLIEEIDSRLRHPNFAERMVVVALERTATTFAVTITDQGSGFDWQNYVEFSPERAFDLHGRGIAMSKALSFDRMEYMGKGNVVVTSLALPAA